MVRFILTGVVTDANTGAAVSGVSVSAINSSTSTNATATTDGNGYYALDDVAVGNVAMRYTASGYNEREETIPVTEGARRDVTIVPFWSRSGSGNNVFDMPIYVERVRIRGTWSGRNGSNFIVRIGGRLVVNEILRTSMTYEGVHLTSGGVVEITNSNDITWQFDQVQ